MKISADHHRPFGNTGLRVPPIMFGTSALGNVRRVIPEQTKLEICGEWFRHVSPPVFVDTSHQDGNGLALEALARAFQRLDVSPEEAILASRISCNEGRFGHDSIRASWDETCRLLCGNHRPQLIAIESPDEFLAAAQTPTDRAQRFQDILEAYRALEGLKATHHVAGIGIAAKDWQVVREIDAAVRLDWVMLVGCFTIMRHPPEVLEFMASLAARQIPMINAGIFHGDFLVGGSSFDSRALTPENPADRSLFAWRKAFAALCHGHGITLAHACIQFALSAPAVAAVAINTSHPDRIAENADSAIAKAPDAFWASMKEEGLLGLPIG